MVFNMHGRGSIDRVHKVQYQTKAKRRQPEVARPLLRTVRARLRAATGEAKVSASAFNVAP